MIRAFLAIINHGFTLGWIVLAVLIARYLLRNASRSVVCGLWAIVLVRFLCPFSIKSIWNMLPSAQTITFSQWQTPILQVNSGFASIDQSINSYLNQKFFIDGAFSLAAQNIFLIACAVLWLLGMLGMLLIAGINLWKLSQKIRFSVPLRDNLRICDEISTPFLFGLLRPRIYLPSTLSPEESDYILAHETMHLKRLDHWWKFLGFLLLCLFWFHPLLWIGYHLLCQDIEVACDERVVRKMDPEKRKAYASILLKNSTSPSIPLAAPLAFGEVSVKHRIQKTLRYKKSSLGMLVLSFLVIGILSVGFLTSPNEEALTQEVKSLTARVVKVENYSITIDPISYTGNSNAINSHITLPHLSDSFRAELENCDAVQIYYLDHYDPNIAFGLRFSPSQTILRVQPIFIDRINSSQK